MHTWDGAEWGHGTPKGSAGAGPRPAVLRGQSPHPLGQVCLSGSHEKQDDVLWSGRGGRTRGRRPRVSGRGDAEPLDSGLGPLWTLLR